MLVHAFTFTFTLSYVNTDNQNKRLTEQLWSAIEDMADMMLCMFMGNTWYVSVVVANERDWGMYCRQELLVLFCSPHRQWLQTDWQFGAVVCCQSAQLSLGQLQDRQDH